MVQRCSLRQSPPPGALHAHLRERILHEQLPSERALENGPQLLHLEAHRLRLNALSGVLRQLRVTVGHHGHGEPMLSVLRRDLGGDVGNRAGRGIPLVEESREMVVDRPVPLQRARTQTVSFLLREELSHQLLEVRRRASCGSNNIDAGVQFQVDVESLGDCDLESVRAECDLWRLPPYIRSK